MMNTPGRMKYDQSPVTSPSDSFMSTSACYQPLSDNVMTTTDMLTPRSFDDESHFGSSVSGTPAPDIKPIKKRKSWGQQLPEPKTNLPPRKRAKTEDEKEQRRVERVLRNRRAAQSSRERKRLEVEALEAEKRAIERKNMDLEMRLADIEAKYRLLEQEFERVNGPRTGLRSYSVPNSRTTGLRSSSPISINNVVNPQDPITVNPASLSPEIRPVANSTNAYYSDMMQHPAAVLCDLQCQSEEIQLWANTTTTSSMVTLQILAVRYLIASSEAFLRIPSHLNQSINAMKKKFSPSPPKFTILNLIIWAFTMMVCLMNLFSATTLTTNHPRIKDSVRNNSLRDLLASSPNLARLMDATMAALRPVSKQLVTRNYFFTITSSYESGPEIYEILKSVLWVTYVWEKGRHISEIFTSILFLDHSEVKGDTKALFKQGYNSTSYTATRFKEIWNSKYQKIVWGYISQRLRNNYIFFFTGWCS